MGSPRCSSLARGVSFNNSFSGTLDKRYIFGKLFFLLNLFSCCEIVGVIIWNYLTEMSKYLKKFLIYTDRVDIEGDISPPPDDKKQASSVFFNLNLLRTTLK